MMPLTRAGSELADGARGVHLLGRGKSWMLRLNDLPGMTPVRVALLGALVLTPVSILTDNPYITPLILAYALWVACHVVTRQQTEIDDLAPVLDLDPDARARTRRDLASHPRLLLALGWVAGPVVMVLINWGGPTITAIRQGAPVDLRSAIGLAVAALFWTVCFQLFVMLLRNAMVFHRLGSRAIRVNLLDIEGLAPLGRIAVRNLLIFVGAYAMIPIALLQNAAFTPSVVAAVAVTLPLSGVLLFLPVAAIHRRLSEAKALELDRIRRALLGDRAAMASSPVGEDAETLTVTNLVLYREMIRQAKEWPINAPVIFRLAAYVVIPLLAWIAAAVVENYVDRLL